LTKLKEIEVGSCGSLPTGGDEEEDPITDLDLLPDGIECLTLQWGNRFARSENNPLGSIKRLNLSDYYKAPISNASLPVNLKVLNFGSRYNRELDEPLPYGITSLCMGMIFNKSLKGKLPDTIQYLILSDRYCQPIGILPSQLKWISFGRKQFELKLPFPSTLKEISLPLNYNGRYFKIDDLPIGIKKIYYPHVTPEREKTMTLLDWGMKNTHLFNNIESMKNYQHCKVYLTMFSTRSTRRRS
jgi:hypothetical protein